MTGDIARGPRFVSVDEPDYPRRFSDLRTPPAGVWIEGRSPGAGDRGLADGGLAIVGSRAASRSACGQVTELAADLARAGYAIVSGGALGIDAAAHRGALEAGGATFAVLGCGIDVVYPDRHAALFREIAGSGGLLSEYGPGVEPRPGQFPARNRLVAALGQVVIVAESRAGSGALITARMAARLGRRLLAIPGSAGCDRLLASGAAASVSSSADVLRALAGGASSASSSVPSAFDDLRRAFDSSAGPVTVEVLALRLGLPVGELLGVLYEAELGGFIARRPGGRFEVIRGH